MSDTVRFDLDAYLDRIGWRGGRRPDAATLRGVHLAHARSIPFENLDPLAGTAPSLAPADLIAKLVRGRRGGYCYEHNTLFTLALEALGFRVTGLAARVVLGADRLDSRPRTHMTLLVGAPGDPQPYLADVGFGAAGALLEAVPLTVDTEFHDAGRRHRFVHVPHEGPLEMWVLEAHERGETAWGGGDGAWSGQYAFTLEPFSRRDFEVFNWHVGTNPRSPFTQRPYIQRTTAERHLCLDGAHFVETRADGTVTERKLTDEAEARRVLDEDFDITVPPGLSLGITVPPGLNLLT
ncbi:arylamine N-acetyltransferase family protein [Streptomyces olivochromogenes]|uniref:arylamine N-acetyltransferase family protein n=1 Tax=Streptomyces olivochromogenes TaxID=1963 RepID=UPI001F439B2D|nr:arylamine N-acetyltransferase [Streptomyces olivochromogenes]MCF3129499.1 arylamine N-acetyltransferase [Streptomyces olivochromogenes]